MQLNTYLQFDGRCEEALTFYTVALGARVERLLRYRDSPEPPPGRAMPGMEDKIMHASVHIGDALVMAADDCTGHAKAFAGFQLLLSVNDPEEAERLFNVLSDGGEVRMPLARTFFAPTFGMLVDRFGIAWMLIVTPT